MKCPYCQQKMRPGYLQNSTQPVQWIPEGSKPSMWKGQPAKYGVPFGGGNCIWKGYTAEAHYCAACGVVIAKVK